MRLDDGDRVVLFTDGITEVRNGDLVEFGEDRLLQLIAAHRHLSAGRLQEVIVSAVRDFSGGTFEDDATLIVLAVG